MMLWIVFLMGVLFFMTARPSSACTTVLVGKAVSETGEVLVGHNEDSGGRYVMRTHIVPETLRTTAETIRFEPETALLPLPEKRARLFWSEARPYIADGGASFCDFYVNGNGVVLCSDNCGKPREEKPELTEGGIGYGIRRLTAERAKSAYDAVQVATGLLDKYGYIGNGRSYHFADKDEIWVLQVVNGKNYAVKRVGDDEVYLNPNHYTIRMPDAGTPGLDKLISYATERGWYNPSDGPFDFARAYQAPEAYRSPRNLHRHLRGLEIILGCCLDSEADLSFSVKPTRKIGVEDVKKVLRCHFEGTPEDVSGGDTPHFMETRPICVYTTLESTVVQIRKNHDMTLIWRALGRPCLSPYAPWYFGIADVPAEYGTGRPDEAVRSHFAVPAADLDYSDAEAWYRYTDLQAGIDPLYRAKGAEIKDALAEFERTLQKEVRYFEPLAEAHFKTDSVKAVGLLTGSVADWAARTLRKLNELYSSLEIVPVDAPMEIDVNAVERPFVVKLDAGLAGGFTADTVVLEKTLFGPHYAPVGKWSKALNVSLCGGKLCLSFKMAEWTKNSAPCLTDLWLILENAEGKRLVGKAVATLTKEMEKKAEGTGPT